MRDAAPGTAVVVKSIFRIFVLRVSGKGDIDGTENQLDMLREYMHVPGVTWLLEHFKAELMQASSIPGGKLRTEWQRTYGLKVLHRQGRVDLLGISLVVDGTRFVLYASTAAQLDEMNGNAFTRHLTTYMMEDAFTGFADPDFMRRRDEGESGVEDHPSLVSAFDVTRIVRNLGQGNALLAAAQEARAAFDCSGVRVDPEEGEFVALMWNFLCFGSEMEASVGKIRRFVGALNKARAGFFPYRAAAAPLGWSTKDGAHRPLIPCEDEQPAVQTLQRLAQQRLPFADIAVALGTAHGVVSQDLKTSETPIHELRLPARAVRRLYALEKLEAYRDQKLKLTFVGRLPNRLQPGAGHVLKRRWYGRNADGKVDEYGAISYTIPAPAPTILDDAGQTRRGWLAGLSAEQERAAWDALIEQFHGSPATGRASSKDAAPDGDGADVAVAHPKSATARSGRAGYTAPIMPLARLCLFRDVAAGADGPRTKLFSRPPSANGRDGWGGGRYELRRELLAPTSHGIERTELIASWADVELHCKVADLLEQVVRRLLDDGHQLGRLSIDAPRSVSNDPAIARRVELRKLRDDAVQAASDAEGFDLLAARAASAAAKVTDPAARALQDDLVKRHEAKAGERRTAAEALTAKADRLEAEPPSMPEVPRGDFGDLADVIAGLRGVFRAGPVPPWFNQLLSRLFEGGLRFEGGPDSLQLHLIGDVRIPLSNGETVVAEGRILVDHRGGWGGGALYAQRIQDAADRYMHNGEDLRTVAATLGMVGTHTTLRTIREYMLSGGRRVGGVLDRAAMVARMPCHELRAVPFAAPIPELRDLIWHRLTGRPGGPSTTHPAWAASTLHTYTTPSGEPERGDQRDTTRPWTFDPHTDGRLDMLTVLASLPGQLCEMTADALAAALDTRDRKKKRKSVRAVSAPIIRNGQTYPATMRRLPAPGFPDGWYGRSTSQLTADQRRMSPPLCPHHDCTERYATVICFAPELTKPFGTASLCRRCLRPAVDTTDAFATPFPDSYVTWFDQLPRRTGGFVKCAHSHCKKDVGAGVGMAWRWDSTPPTTLTWHDEVCRAGPAPARFTTCHYAGCTLDEGAGAGSMANSHSTRRWHNRSCRAAHDRSLPNQTTRPVN